MISTSQLKSGVISYIDCELIPLLPEVQRFVAGTYVALAQKGIEAKIEQLLGSPLIAMTGIVNDVGLIDEDALYEAMLIQMRKQTQLTLPIPFLGDFNLKESDLNKLLQHVKREGKVNA